MGCGVDVGEVVGRKRKHGKAVCGTWRGGREGWRKIGCRLFCARHTHSHTCSLHHRPVVAEFTITLRKPDVSLVRHGSQVFGEVLRPSRWCGCCCGRSTLVD